MEYKPLSQRVKTSKKLDNYQTPISALEPLVPYLRLAGIRKIWEPACGVGNLVYGLNEAGFVCLGTDILEDSRWDFLTSEASNYEAIVTNPPYTLKNEFLARCYELGKPFALLMNITSLEGRKRQALYRENGIEVIMPNGRINYATEHGNDTNGAWFYSAWFTHGLNIGRDLVFAPCS